MRPGWRGAAIALACVAQLGVCAWMIAGAERTLAQGELFLFRTRPVDPVDLLRGRYVTLAFEQRTAPAEPGSELARGDRAFALLEVDAEGFARVRALRAEPPPEGVPALPVVVGAAGGDGSLYFELPFDRYYLDEAAAPAAERAYREQASTSWLAVRVRGQTFAVEELYLDGVPVREFLARGG